MKRALVVVCAIFCFHLQKGQASEPPLDKTSCEMILYFLQTQEAQQQRWEWIFSNPPLPREAFEPLFRRMLICSLENTAVSVVDARLILAGSVGSIRGGQRLLKQAVDKNLLLIDDRQGSEHKAVFFSNTAASQAVEYFVGPGSLYSIFPDQKP